jgi:hypothetical protein
MLSLQPIQTRMRCCSQLLMVLRCSPHTAGAKRAGRHVQVADIPDAVGAHRGPVQVNDKRKYASRPASPAMAEQGNCRALLLVTTCQHCPNVKAYAWL